MLRVRTPAGRAVHPVGDRVLSVARRRNRGCLGAVGGDREHGAVAHLGERWRGIFRLWMGRLGSARPGGLGSAGGASVGMRSSAGVGWDGATSSAAVSGGAAPDRPATLSLGLPGRVQRRPASTMMPITAKMPTTKPARSRTWAVSFTVHHHRGDEGDGPATRPSYFCRFPTSMIPAARGDEGTRVCVAGSGDEVLGLWVVADDGVGGLFRVELEPFAHFDADPLPPEQLDDLGVVLEVRARGVAP